MSTSVPQPTFGPNGFVAPTEAAILAGRFADINASFGGNLNPSLASPQGQLASTEASIIGNVYDLFTFYTTQTDPAFATGRMQDAIGRIYGIERLPAEATVVSCVCSGLAGLTIPVGALAVAGDGNIYSCTGSGSILASGSVTLSFSCNKLGPIVCPAGSLNQIYQAIPGWDSITNPSAGVVGQNVESRYAFEARRRESVAQNSLGSIESVRGAVLAVPGVLDAYVTENVAGSGVVIGGFTVAARSIYVAAVGGTDLDVATAIWSRKSPGCAYNGNTTVVVTDSNAGFSAPLPTYNVTFDRPASLPILFQVNIVNGPLVPADAITQVQAAIISAFAGGDGGSRARIGSTLYATRYVSPIAALGSWAQVASILIGSDNAPLASFTGSIGGSGGVVLNVTAVSSGTIGVGQTISGTGIALGTQITSLGTGVGGTGTYIVNVSQAAASQAIKASKAAAGSVSVNINQVPTISQNEILVSLI